MNKRALIIGINDYRDIDRLRGCVNDTTNLRLILEEFAGFDGDQIRLLVDSRATKRAIEQRLQWLVEGAQPGDLLVLHFSGHGSQIRDRDEQDELADGLDEILCPWDMDWDETFINDDDLRSVLSVPDGVVLEVILDCCNSGEGSVEVGMPRPARAGDGELELDRTPRFAQPPVDVVSRHAGANLGQRKLLEQRAPKRLALWSACADFQTAADARIDGIANGAFTFYFCKHLRDAQGDLSRAELLEQVKSSLARAGYTQVPELAAPADFLSARPFAGEGSS
jgi:hypothetical protein